MSPTLLLVLDLVGTFVFALNGALTAVRTARLDIVGVVTLGMITALGGGILRDLVIGAVPPATFDDWRYLAVATAGGLIAFALPRGLDRLSLPINLLAFFDFPGLDVGPYAEVLGGLHHMAISVDPDRWATLVERLTEAGVPHEVHSGVSVYFRDPDGARIELIADPLGEMYGQHVL